MGRFFYFFGEAFRGFVQAKLMTFVSIVTIAVSLFVLGLVGAGYLTIWQWLQSAMRQPGMAVYIEEAAYEDTAKCSALVNKLRACPQVLSAALIGKDSAWARFESMYGKRMLDAVDKNPLPASLEITLAPSYQSPQAVEEFRASLAALDGVAGVHYSREWLAVLKKIRTWFLWGTVAIAPFLILALHFMIANTIKLTIYARRDLVRNMRFVGATDFYIKMPFVLEGMLQGTIGAAASVVALAGVRVVLSRFAFCWGPPYVPSYLPVAILFLVGVIFGWIGSMSAVRKFLQ